VVVADDGLQHYRLRRQCEIVVLDGRRRFGNGRFIPAGPLREPVRRLDLADAIVVNGGTARPGEIAMRLVGTRARNLRDGSERALASFAGTRLHAVAGIGNPQRFFASLTDEGLTVIEHAFPDHHAFQPGDLEFGDALPVLMTEKDAVKCRAFPREGWWVVPVGAHIDAAAAGTLMTRIAAAIRESSSK
jgi:tetraacyldisaccharide 4'-kinase